MIGGLIFTAPLSYGAPATCSSLPPPQEISGGVSQLAAAKGETNRPGTGAVSSRREEASPSPANLLKNPGFEARNPQFPHKPADWETLTDLKPPFADLGAEYKWEGRLAPSGHRALTIKTTTGDKEAAWVQKVSGLQPGGWYRVTAWVKTGKMEPNLTVLSGAGLVVTFFIHGVKDAIDYPNKFVPQNQNWSKQEITFVVPENFSQMVLRLSSFRAKGTVSWADVAVVPLPDRDSPDRDLARFPPLAKAELDRFGGWKKVKGRATGFFHTEKIGDRWWLITPEGHGFIVAGVIHIAPRLDSSYMTNIKRRYQNLEKWGSFLSRRLADWGFNTFFSNQQFPPPWRFVSEVPISPLVHGRLNIDPDIRVGVVTNLDSPYAAVCFFPDVFDPKFRMILERDASKFVNPSKNDPWLLCCTLSGELPWDYFLLDMFLALPGDRPGKKALVTFLRERYQNQVQLFNAAWGTKLKDFGELVNLRRFSPGGDLQRQWDDRSAFLTLAAETYFNIAHEVLRKNDPNHLILGARFWGYEVPPEVLKVVGKYADIVAFQPYELVAPRESLEKSYQYHQKPILITEFSFPAADSGLPNSLGAGKTLPTQKDRGLFFERYVSHLLSSPIALGYVWYKYVDDLPDADKENCNYGLVNKEDEPYSDLVDRIKRLNQRIYHLTRFRTSP